MEFKRVSRFRRLIKREKPLWCLMGVYLILALIYNVTNPILESPDAIWHFRYILYLAQGKGLPHYTGTPLPMHQEASQPPLYYLLAVPLVALVDTSDAEEVLRFNPHAAVGLASAYGNKNVLIHPPDERFPYRGTALAVHLVRLLSTLLGALTVLFAYRAAKLLMPEGAFPAFFAASLVAFNPQFIFLSASVNNDNLVTALGAIAFYLLVNSWLDLPAGRRMALLGVILGLAAITKLNGLVLSVLVIGFLPLVAWRHRAWKSLPYWAIIIMLSAATVAGWWYIRNLILYGDPTGLKVMFAVYHRRSKAPDLRELLLLFEGVRKSFWAVFGWFNVVAHPWIYPVLDFWMLLGFTGFGVFAAGLLLRREWDRLAQWSIAVAWVAVYTLALWKWSQMRYPQGRMLFPALPAFTALWARGWLVDLLGRWGRRLSAVSAVGLFVLALSVPFVYIQPAYARPPLLEETGIPFGLHKLNWVYGGSIRLVGVDIYPESVVPGQELYVKACWQVLKPLDRNYSVFVHVWGKGGVVPGGDIPAQVDTYPGLGAWPTKYLPPGKVLCDEYHLSIPVDMEAPARLTVEMGVYDFQSPGHPGLQAVDEGGNPIALGIVGYVTLVPR